MTEPRSIEESLRSLSACYAAGVDRRDLELFLGAFHMDASLIVYPVPTVGLEPTRIMRGHDEIGQVTQRISAYAKTFHKLGQGLYDIDEYVATGEVYCVAYHLTVDGPMRTNRVMYIRYQDSYRRTPGGDWRIGSREVRPDWTEIRDVSLAT
jgi:hypothetical protein